MNTPLLIRALAWLWLLAIVFIGQSRQLTGAPAWLLPAMVVGLAAALLATTAWVALLRTWFWQVEVRSLVMLHVTRFTGFYYLHLFGAGALPAEFALSAGWSENLVAGSALVVAFIPVRAQLKRRLLTIWNIVGFGSAAVLTWNLSLLVLSDRAQFAQFMDLPLLLIPGFLLPLVLASHLHIHRRLEREAQGPAT